MNQQAANLSKSSHHQLQEPKETTNSFFLPLSQIGRFSEKPFQNSTREHADLLGAAFLYTDYSIPVAALRQHFAKILDASPLWNHNVCATQVTNLSETTMEIRCLLSARNASEQLDLRCIIREAMITFHPANYPDSFPRTRFAAIGPNTPAQPPTHRHLIRKPTKPVCPRQ